MDSLLKKLTEFLDLNKSHRDVLRDQLTAVPGVSDVGIEARRGDKRQEGVVSHGYGRSSDQSKHLEMAKKIHKALLHDLKSEKKPDLPKSETLTKPYVSDAQRRWAHTEAGTKALGGESAVHEWDQATKGKHIPERAHKMDMGESEPGLIKGKKMHIKPDITSEPTMIVRGTTTHPGAVNEPLTINVRKNSSIGPESADNNSEMAQMDSSDFRKNGEKLYHIHDGKDRITSKPMTLKDLTLRHGPVQKLESAGFRVIEHKPAMPQQPQPAKIK